VAVHLTGAGYRHPRSGPAAPALQPLDLVIHQGEQLAVIGPSGAGKTTLLHLLATALRPASGELRVLDRDPWQLSRRRRRALRCDIGLIQQTPPLPPRQRVTTAVSAGRLGHWSAGKSLLNLFWPLDITGVRHHLSLLDVDDKLHDRCDQLSGGQLQRVAIARTLYQQPRLICADEPVSALDPLLASHTLGVLQQEARRQAATLVASLHAVDLALRHFDRVIGLREGKLIFDSSPGEISAATLAGLYANEQLAANAVARQSVLTDADVGDTALADTDVADTTLAEIKVPGRGYPCR